MSEIIKAFALVFVPVYIYVCIIILDVTQQSFTLRYLKQIVLAGIILFVLMAVIMVVSVYCQLKL